MRPSKQYEHLSAIMPYQPRYDIGYQSVHFNLKSQKKQLEPVQIMLSVRIDGRRFRVYTGHKVEPAFWDVESGRCRCDDLLSPRVRKRMKELNSFLERIFVRLEMADRNAAEHDKLLTIEDLRQIVLEAGETARSQTASQPSPIDTLRRIAENFSKQLSDKGTLGTTSSSKAYIHSVNRLSAFVGETNFDLSDFARLNHCFYRDFAQWLNERVILSGGKPRHYSAATVQSSLSCIVNLHHKAHVAGITEVPEYRYKNLLPATSAKSTKIYLTESELSALGKVCPENRREKEVLDMFILSSYTGLRLSDINEINNAIISDGTLRLFQKKTHEYVTIPLLKEVRGIIGRYSKSPDGFPHIDPSHANRTIKMLCKSAGIDSNTPVRECRGGKFIVRNCPKYELVSFHTARRSCITNLYRRGYSPNYIMTMSGHKSISSFQRYVKNSEEEIALDFMRQLKRQKAL